MAAKFVPFGDEAIGYFVAIGFALMGLAYLAWGITSISRHKNAMQTWQSEYSHAETDYKSQRYQIANTLRGMN